MRGESRWDREDRLVAKGRRVLAFLNLGLIMCGILTAFVLASSVAVENGLVAWAAWKAGYAAGRYGREWPMPDRMKPFEPARAPL